MVPVRLSEEEVRKLKLLMQRGTYRSRNEAIRAILTEGVEQRLGEDEDVSQLVNMLVALSKSGKTPISFRAERSIVEIVAEGRK